VHAEPTFAFYCVFELFDDNFVFNCLSVASVGVGVSGFDCVAKTC